MHTSESQWNPDEIIDTQKLQVFALKEFMLQLGYEIMKSSVNGNWHFHSNQYSNRGRSKISVGHAISLYNGNSVRCVFGRPPHKLSIFSFDDYSIAKAKAARILKSIKLQYCRQTKQILCQDHRVQFIVESYSRLFLHNKYL